MKPIRLTKHALEQCDERGATEEEVIEAIRKGTHVPAKKGRIKCKINFPFHSEWMGKEYAIKQVAPIIIENDDEIVVITVYTFYS